MRGSDLPGCELPSGNVCFLFTDVEASTAILRAVGDAEWARRQGQMHDIVRSAVEAHGGAARTVRVRMGLHLGTGIQPSNDDYVALAVHQTARVAAAANGGQALATAAMVAACDRDDRFADPPARRTKPGFQPDVRFAAGRRRRFCSSRSSSRCFARSFACTSCNSGSASSPTGACSA